MSNKIPAITLIALILALVIGVILSILYFISAFRFVDSRTYLSSDGSFSSVGSPDQDVVALKVSLAVDSFIVYTFISEFGVRNGGAHPSSQYLQGLKDAGFLSFYEKVEIKGKDDYPAGTALPQVKEAHIWPGYGCALEQGSLLAPAEVFRPGEIDYDELIVKHSDASKYSILLLDIKVMSPDLFLGRFPQGQVEVEWVFGCHEYDPDNETGDS